MITESTVQTICRLLAAWIHHTDLDVAETPDYEALFQTANRHLLSAAACAALEQTGLMEDCPPETARRFREAEVRSVRKTILMDAERGKILTALEEKGIWYAPLKGPVINAVYPQYGTRQFADNDILFDAERWRDVRKHMRRNGYTAEGFRVGIHDIYYKQPLYNFEMHRKLFSADIRKDILYVYADYYGNVRDRLIKDVDNRFGYHFSDEDFYIYFLAHAYKHYYTDGTGLRTLLDVYLYRRARPEMDTVYIGEELRKLGLTEFETVCRSLGEKLFSPVPCTELTEQERDMLNWAESSGVYGTIDHCVQSGLRRLQNDEKPVTFRTKMRYLFRWFFPEWDWYRLRAPFVYRHRWAVPFYWVYRLFRGVFVYGRENLREAGAVITYHER